jgi:aryl-alcohol dehydrogenase-like predicted oxidoreductase
MNYRTLGRTELKVSEIGFGAWAIGGNEHGNSYGTTVDDVSIRTIQRALEMGCTFFDTADVYGHGHSEEVLGAALEGHRDAVVIATKVGGDFYEGATRMNFTPEYMQFACDRSLERLGTDVIDLYQLHNPTGEMIAEGSVFDVFGDLQAAGKIRFGGVSIFDPAEGVAAITTGKVDAIQVVFNLFSTEPVAELFPLALEQGVGIITREPLANGFLTGKYTPGATFEPGDIRRNWPPQTIAARSTYADKLRAVLERPGERTLVQAALRFALAHPAVSTAIPGAKTPEQVAENCGASEAPSFDEADLARVKDIFGSN